MRSLEGCWLGLEQGRDFCGGHGIDPGLSTKLICFETSIVDWTDQLADPVDVLFGVKLGSGTDVNSALGYYEKQIENPTKTHLGLITDLYEGGDAKSMLGRAAAIKQSV